MELNYAVSRYKLPFARLLVYLSYGPIMLYLMFVSAQSGLAQTVVIGISGVFRSLQIY